MHEDTVINMLKVNSEKCGKQSLMTGGKFKTGCPISAGTAVKMNLN